MTTPLHTTSTGAGPTVLFVHGLDSDATVWDRTVELLPDHTCVAVDLPGHGLTPAPVEAGAYERDAVLGALDDVIAGLEGPVVLAGHSLGGYLGLAHAITRPDMLDGLVLVSTGPGFRDPRARDDWNHRVREGAAEYRIPEVAASIAFHVDAMVIDRFTEITIPIALVIGDGDRAYIGANDYMEKKLPQARRTTVEGARHYVMRSHPDEVAAAVRAVTDTVAV